MTVFENALCIVIAGVVLLFQGTSSNEGADSLPSIHLQELQERMRILQDQHGDWLKRQQQFIGLVEQLQHDLRKQRQEFDKQIESVRWESDRQDKELLDLQKQRAEFEEEMRVFREDRNHERDELRSRLAEQDETIKFLHRQLNRHCLHGAEDTPSHREPRERLRLQQNVSETETAALKRSDDYGPLESVLSHVTQQMTEMTSEIQALKNADQQQDQARGTAYTRWGHTACPDSSELVYTGIVSGTHNSASGGAGNHLCLTSQPTFDSHRTPSEHGHTYIYGSEYEICPEVECQLTPACAVCRVSRAASVMIAGTNSCSPGWTKEYSGYIMAGRADQSSSEFICVDSSHGFIHSLQANDNQNLLHYTVAKCGALPCPPYVDEKMVTCVVCTK